MMRIREQQACQAPMTAAQKLAVLFEETSRRTAMLVPAYTSGSEAPSFTPAIRDSSGGRGTFAAQKCAERLSRAKARQVVIQ